MISVLLQTLLGDGSCIDHRSVCLKHGNAVSWVVARINRRSRFRHCLLDLYLEILWLHLSIQNASLEIQVAKTDTQAYQSRSRHQCELLKKDQVALGFAKRRASEADGRHVERLALAAAAVLVMARDDLQVVGTSSSAAQLAVLVVHLVGLVVAALKECEAFEAHFRGAFRVPLGRALLLWAGSGSLLNNLCKAAYLSQSIARSSSVRLLNHPCLSGFCASAQLSRLADGLAEPLGRAGGRLVHSMVESA